MQDQGNAVIEFLEAVAVMRSVPIELNIAAAIALDEIKGKPSEID